MPTYARQCSVRQVSPYWYVSMLAAARSAKWCNKLGCTTCGGGDFRSHIEQSLKLLSDGRTSPISLAIQDISATPIDAAKAISGGRWFRDTIFILAYFGVPEILMGFGMLNLNSVSLAQNVDPSTMGSLCNSNVFQNTLAQMEAMKSAFRQRREGLARRESEMQEAAKKRRAMKFARHADRLVLHKERSSTIQASLEKLQALSTYERLWALADDRYRLPLEVVPWDENLVSPDVIDELPSEVRLSLALRIDRRRGRWGCLKSRLITPYGTESSDLPQVCKLSLNIR